MNSAPKEKLRAFIGCTEEGKAIAQALHSEIESWCYPERWDQGIFHLSKTIIEGLETELRKFDFSIFLLTPDDIAIIRGKEYSAPRDNLIFELGLSYAFLGRSRTYIILPKGSDLKLPSDIAGVLFEEYDAKAPNKQAALTTSSERIRTALEHSKKTKPCDFCREHLMHVLGEVGDRFYQELDLIFEKTSDLVFSQGVVRKNWTIDLSYDFSKISNNIITENIIWEYEFINITKSSLEYPYKIYMIEGDINTIIDLSRIDSNNNRVSIFPSDELNTSSSSSFVRKELTITMPPGVSHFLKLHFVFDHPVCPNTHYIHNCFAPREPTMSASIRAHIPEGYDFGVLGQDLLTPHYVRNVLYYRFKGPLLPEQVIEYVFKKKEIDSEG